jgi:hypothetical protein
MGNDPMPGNEKLAADSSGKCLAETRAQGGYIVGYDSGGEVHPSGGRWKLDAGGYDAIAWIEMETWLAIKAILVEFDETSPVQAPAAPAARPGPGGVALGEITGSYLDQARAAMPTMREVLERYDWQFHHQDADYIYMTRPGKDVREGVSATINARDRLFVHSTNAQPVPASPGRTTYSVIDVLAFYEGVDGGEIVRQYKPSTPRSEPAADLYLPGDFWSAAPWLSKLRDAALARMIAPETVLGAFLSAYSATIPMSIKVPAIVAAEAPLNYYTCLVGPSGSGKSAAATLASQLLGFSRTQFPHVLLNQGLRSGEGLVTLAVLPSSKSKDGVVLEPSYRNGIQITFDEGEGAARQAERLGSSTLSYLCSAWSGPNTMIGGAKASGVEGFPADLVRISVQMGTQPGVAGALFTGGAAAQGFPQRFVYFATDNPVVLSLSTEPRRHERLEPLEVRMWPHQTYGRDPIEMAYGPEMEREILIQHRGRIAGEGESLDGHKGNLKLRTAALLALASGSVVVGNDSWNLAGQIETASRSVRRMLVASIGNIKQETARAAGELDAVRIEGRDSRWARGKAERLARWMSEATPSADDGFARKELKARFNTGERKRLDEIIDCARSFGWVIHRDGRYFVGPSKPSSA